MSSNVALETPKKPSFVPVIFGAIFCLISLVILFFFRHGNPLIYFAYVCTPFAPIAGLALARSTDIKGRTSIHFDIAKSEKVLKFCGILAVIGFLIAIGVMIEIAMRLSSI